MANSKSEQHIINLANPDLNRERLKGEIKPWDGFNDRNSPYLSGECLPLYTKTISGSNQWISPSLDVYKVASRRLQENGTNIGPTLDKITVTKMNITSDHTYFLGGTQELYAIADTGVDAVWIYKNNNRLFDTPITYGDGFSWDECIRWFGLNYQYVGTTEIIVVCWGGKLVVYKRVGSGAWSSSENPSKLQTYDGRLLASYNTALYIGTSKIFCWNAYADHGAIYTISDGTWTNLSSLTVYYYVQVSPGSSVDYSKTVSAHEVFMDQTGHAVSLEAFDGGVLGQFISSDLEVNESNNTFSKLNYVIGPVIIPSADYHIKDYPNTPATLGRYGINIVQYICENQNDPTDSTGAYAIVNSTLEHYSGVTIQSGDLQGGSHRTLGNFRLLYYGGQLVSVSCTDFVDQNTSCRGTLLCPWGTVSDCYYLNNKLSFLSSSDNTWYYFTVSTSSPTYTVYKDRYIILRTTRYYNTYDTIGKTWLHFADDWNHRLQGIEPNDRPWSLIASAVEAEYALSGFPFPGLAVGKTWVKYNTYSGNQFEDVPEFIAWKSALPSGYNVTSSYVDVYLSKSLENVNFSNVDDSIVVDTNAEYKMSLGGSFVVRDYIGLYWSDDDAIQNPPLFATFQTDLYTMIFIGSTSVLALQQFGKEFLIYYAATSDTSFTRLCCVQSLFYGLTDDGIYSVDLSNGVLSNSRKIANITGLQYIAYNPLGIVFWNPRNRTMYMFTGDAVLKPIEGQSSFTSITQSKFRPDTEETFMLTNNGLYVSANNYCYNIKGVYTDVFFTDYGFALKESNKCTCYAYYPAEGHTTLVPLVLETMLYGAGNNIISTTDCIYLRFYRGDIGNTTANVKISGHTLTDFSTELQDENGKTYTITKDDWDTTTNTYYLRYQPTYQKGLGLSIRVESDVPLIYMGFGAKSETLQITK
jgi:hypothetical protein